MKDKIQRFIKTNPTKTEIQVFLNQLSMDFAHASPPEASEIAKDEVTMRLYWDLLKMRDQGTDEIQG